MEAVCVRAGPSLRGPSVSAVTVSPAACAAGERPWAPCFLLPAHESCFTRPQRHELQGREIRKELIRWLRITFPESFCGHRRPGRNLPPGRWHHFLATAHLWPTSWPKAPPRKLRSTPCLRELVNAGGRGVKTHSHFRPFQIVVL